MKDYSKVSYVMSLDLDVRKARKSQKRADKARKISSEKKERKTNYLSLYYKNKF